jgi:low temperature requirement protein LtrA
VAPAVVLDGGFLSGSTRMWVWLGGLCLEVGAALLAGRGSFQVRVGHFAERHGLFVIIALGEAIIAVGVAATGVVRNSALALVLLAGFAGAVVLWLYSRLRSLPLR